jgi:anti-sigma regulatory factor (Ser/Thr protein kinase)
VGTVELRFTPVTAHVRTARLVATSLGRRFGLGEEALDEVRLAVGETCARAVALHRAQELDTPVVVTLDDGPSAFSVEVEDFSAPDAPEPEPGLSLAVVTGLVDDVVVERGPGSNRVRMVWPAARREVLSPDPGGADAFAATPVGDASVVGAPSA